MRNILIVGASVLQMPAILRAKEMGFFTTVIDINEKAIGVPFADRFYKISTTDTEGILKLSRSIKPEGIVTLATDLPMRSVAYVTSKLGLPGVSEETALLATDKIEMIKAFQSAGVARPWYYTVDSHIDFLSISSMLRFPCIIKPACNSGSRGVVLVKNSDRLFESYEYSKSNSRDDRVIIEEYMEGPEVSVELMVISGEPHVIAVTDKYTTGAPHFVEMGHSQPSVLSADDIDSIKVLAKLAVKAIKLENGPAHAEIILTKDGPKMVEIGARLGGDFISSHLVKLSTGVDLVKATIAIATGGIPDIEIKAHSAAAIRFLSLPEGEIKSVSGVKRAQSTPGVTDVTFFKSVGDTTTKIRSSIDRAAVVISKSDTPQKAARICERAIKKIKIEIEN